MICCRYKKESKICQCINILENEMEYSYIIQGYILGFSLATTIGISGILCLQNMMTGRISVSLVSALAASLADMCCATLVVFGLQAGQHILLAYKFTFSIITGIFLCILGIEKLFTPLVLHSAHQQSNTVIKAFISIFFLALVDPVSILDFIALCMGLTFDFSAVQNAVVFVGGLFLGSFTWWILLCCLLLYFRKTLSVNTLQFIQHCVGAGIFAFGIWTLFVTLH